MERKKAVQGRIRPYQGKRRGRSIFTIMLYCPQGLDIESRMVAATEENRLAF